MNFGILLLIYFTLSYVIVITAFKILLKKLKNNPSYKMMYDDIESVLRFLAYLSFVTLPIILITIPIAFLWDKSKTVAGKILK